MGYSFKFSDSLIEDVENLRSFLKNFDKQLFVEPPLSSLISLIIENNLRRRLQQKSAEFIPSEKEQLEKERDKYKDQAESIYKWFAYYQDKCRIIEKKTGKFVIPEFPDKEYPAGSGPLGF